MHNNFFSYRLILAASLFAVIFALASATLYAGHQCSTGKLCGMRSCTSFDHSGTPTGMKCIQPNCHKGCCTCTDACNRNEPTPNPDESIYFRVRHAPRRIYSAILVLTGRRSCASYARL